MERVAPIREPKNNKLEAENGMLKDKLSAAAETAAELTRLFEAGDIDHVPEQLAALSSHLQQ